MLRKEDNDADALAMLRKQFTRHIAYERKAGSSNFLEYWVPAYLSQVQLELYTSMLLENSSILQSQRASDSVGALHDIVMCLSKVCCQKNPFICNQHVQVHFLKLLTVLLTLISSWLYVTVLQSPLPRWPRTFTCQHFWCN
jgi:hypothetical protein